MDKIQSTSFEEVALEVFRYQYQGNEIYREYVDALSVDPNSVSRVESIPFLPIEFFKTHAVKTGNWEEEETFTSSGTTGMQTSKHLVRVPEEYLLNCRTGFESTYGDLSDHIFLALLPSYLERRGSSLISMMRYFIEESDSKFSGFFLHDHNKLIEQYEKCIGSGKKVMLWGVSFALLDLAENNNLDLSKAIIVETGGMKGRRKEIIREEFHSILHEKLNSGPVHSEYGMTELFSQAYSQGNGVFRSTPLIKVVTRDISDPLTVTPAEEGGCINVIDLANLHTCSFIATQDVGKWHDNGTFEITGRLDNSDIRGCNLMIV